MAQNNPIKNIFQEPTLSIAILILLPSFGLIPLNPRSFTISPNIPPLPTIFIPASLFAACHMAYYNTPNTNNANNDDDEPPNLFDYIVFLRHFITDFSVLIHIIQVLPTVILYMVSGTGIVLALGIIVLLDMHFRPASDPREFGDDDDDGSGDDDDGSGDDGDDSPWYDDKGWRNDVRRENLAVRRPLLLPRVFVLDPALHPVLRFATD